MRGSALLFPIFSLALLAILTYWVNISVQPPANKADLDNRHDPDYYLTNFETIKTDPTGALRYQLKADNMKHFPDDDSTTLIKPYFQQYRLSKPYIKVEGLYGEVSSDGTDIKLYKNVLVTRVASPDKGEMTLETEYLNILPEEDIVLTQKPIIIKQAPRTVIYATGMVYEKKKLTLTLLNKVRAHYEKPIKKSADIESLAVEAPQNIGHDILNLKNKAALPDNLANPNFTIPNTAAQNTTVPPKKERIRRHYE